jgi:hypothetical protein
MDPDAGPRPCTNCGHELAAPVPPFCPQCGQETRIRAPRLGEFLQQFGGAYLATEGALWRTLKLLLFKPGELTRQYLAGRRKHYVLPLRLYLTISLVVLLAIRIVGVASIDGAMQIDAGDMPKEPKQLNYNLLALGEGTGAGMRKGEWFCEGLPGWVCKRLERVRASNPQELQQVMHNVGERLLANLGLGMFVLLPSFALWLKLVYWSRRLHYTEHLVFALHVHAFWFAMLALSLFNVPWLSFAAFAAMPIYAIVAMRRVYGGRLGWRLLRAGAVLMLQIFALTLAMVLVLLWALLA